MRRLIPILVTLVLAACGDDDVPRNDTSDTAGDTAGDTSDTSDDTSDTGTDTNTPRAALEATIAALCPGYAAAYCGADCGCDDAPGFPEDCVAAFTGNCAARLEGYLPMVESGQAEFLASGATACLAAFEPLAATCVSFPEDLFFFVCPILAPPGGFPALPALGEPCEGGCETGLRCSTEGECIVPGVVGATCQSGYDCETTLVCADGLCAAPRHGDIGKRCANNDDCGGDTGCLASARKVCKTPDGAGGCRSDEDCPTNQWCDTTPETGVCKPGGGSGEACGNGIVCEDGLACSSTTATCGPYPGKGEPCAMGRLGPFLCAEGLVCLDTLNCGDAPTEGQLCGVGRPGCAAGLGCAFTPEGSICRVKADAGATCENDDTCRDDLFCDFGTNTCTPFMARGELCTDGNECGPTGSCLPDASFVFRCADKPGVGEECFLDDCEAGLICRTPYEAGVCTPVLCTMMRF
jgi:hypothetical protein